VSSSIHFGCPSKVSPSKEPTTSGGLDKGRDESSGGTGSGAGIELEGVRDVPWPIEGGNKHFLRYRLKHSALTTRHSVSIVFKEFLPAHWILVVPRNMTDFNAMRP
jgi:hypothetical protein